MFSKKRYQRKYCASKLVFLTCYYKTKAENIYFSNVKNSVQITILNILQFLKYPEYTNVHF